jgi:NAD(P)-dependent dehydrogenase (short-subunit alcohol dehydrogenase family)
MDLQLAGKVAVVTGGSCGIGLATVRLLLAEGMHVLAGSRRSTPELEATAAAHLARSTRSPRPPRSCGVAADRGSAVRGQAC